MTVTITTKTKDAINSVAGECIWDMPEDSRSPMIMAEVSIDANRLSTFGYPEADQEIRSLIEKHGYQAVLEAVAEFVPTYI